MSERAQRRPSAVETIEADASDGMIAAGVIGASGHRRNATVQIQRRPGRRDAVGFRVGVAVALLLALAGCGSTATKGSSALRTVTPVATTPSTIPAETVPEATISTSPPIPLATTTTSTTAVLATDEPTTVADDPTAGLPVPEAVPADPHASEPVVPLGSIEIPKIGVSKTFYEGVTLTTLDRGPGHWPGTAMPGEVGNVVVGGHRTSHDKPFRNIDKLVAGDEVVFTTDAGRFVYTVTSTEVVTPDAIRIIDQTPEHTATLFACTPPGSTSHRLVIHLVLAA
ncbi:MAG: class E sortase [Ilumatobacteraceae bacterium]